MAEAAAAPVALTSVAAGKSPLPTFPDNPPASGWTRQVTCRYFMHGVCKEGNNCRYSHDLSTSRSSMICRYYQRGCCAYGDHCRYEHTKPLKPEVISDTSVALICPLNSLPETSGSINSKAADLAASDLAAGVSKSEDWVNAVEFVPGQLYCGRAPSGPDTDTQGTSPQEEDKEQPADPELKKQLCPYAAVGECRYGENCVYLHGDPCDMCGLQVLHPTDMSQRSEHIKSCIEAHEKDMELSFAIQRSKDIVCGICMEVVYEKTNLSERRFGILSNCNHSYCLKCIRRWRSAKQFESKIIKSCPECRITSNFVIPSEYWVEEKEEKQKLIQKYKEAMSNKSCRYFDEGRGTCPFGGNCFYKHAYPDGRIEEPQPRQKGGMSSRYRAQRRNRFWEFEEREGGDPFDNDDDDMVTFELGEMLLMLLAAGADEDLTDSEDEWDLFHEELDNFYDLDL
ncbi:PREDICTED: E3 ubiquitin-protein ligase makorin-1 isoform X1 [Nanorana parkeri]|uniref:E3 ubiquitin-protein ligase makorin-1 isoform X1 n=1 Tax=Nanorana parkeri TaxID=125878 RepID=UPI000854D007|nr:PREDICTED: E3 ubiquitin-protein ligase makorin-1 isoform X1 [Nanorana parkeri]